VVEHCGGADLGGSSSYSADMLRAEEKGFCERVIRAE